MESGFQIAGLPDLRSESNKRADPVFVLCMGRSGSTLLRFLLDAHPDLACPPETNLPTLCGQLAVVWSLIEGAPLSQNRGDTPPKVPDAAIMGIRHTVDMMTASYLARRGKKLFCDKSLGSARFAELLLRVYPGARFICLYRHPMDMIQSGLEACPWGLSGYGFESYISESPGNAILALARYWLDNAGPVLAFEEAHPDQCHRVRYEDLVTAPERVVQGIYRFIGVAEARGVTQTCFTAGRERFGPADHKIWATSRITADSVGRGQSVPIGLIPEPIIDGINDLVGRLGYREVDEDWGTQGQPSDPRLPETQIVEQADRTPLDIDDYMAQTRAIAHHLHESMSRADALFIDRWNRIAADSFAIVARASDANDTETCWVVDLGAQTVTMADTEQDDAEWTVLGSPETWNAVLSGRTNLHTAMRRFDLRYCSASDEEEKEEENIEAAPFEAETRIAMLADLLGLASWQPLKDSTFAL